MNKNKKWIIPIVVFTVVLCAIFAFALQYKQNIINSGTVTVDGVEVPFNEFLSKLEDKPKDDVVTAKLQEKDEKEYKCNLKFKVIDFYKDDGDSSYYVLDGRVGKKRISSLLKPYSNTKIETIDKLLTLKKGQIINIEATLEVERRYYKTLFGSERPYLLYIKDIEVK